jgi:hypothetical protein
LILILIVVIVLFTFVTGANKGTEHFSTRECDREYKTKPPFGACPSACGERKKLKSTIHDVCDETNTNCKKITKKHGWVCYKK